MDKLEFLRIYNFCVSKDIKEVERQHREWEKVFINHVSDKRFVSRTYFLKTSLKRQTTLLTNGQRFGLDISPNKIQKWSTSTCKDAQHH